MRDLDSAILSQINARQGLVVRNFIWVRARNRDDGSEEAIGIWNGEDVIELEVDGDDRVYYGAGAFIGLNDLKQETTLNIRRMIASVSPISPEIETVLRTYDPKLAPIEVHVGFYNPATNQLVADLYRVYKAWIDKFPIKTPAIGGEGSGSIEMVSHTRLLTKTLASKRSNENQQKRQSNDTFFKDVAITGTVTTPWGSKAVVATAFSRNQAAGGWNPYGMLGRGFW